MAIKLVIFFAILILAAMLYLRRKRSFSHHTLELVRAHINRGDRRRAESALRAYLLDYPNDAEAQSLLETMRKR